MSGFFFKDRRGSMGGFFVGRGLIGGVGIFIMK